MRDLVSLRQANDDAALNGLRLLFESECKVGSRDLPRIFASWLESRGHKDLASRVLSEMRV